MIKIYSSFLIAVSQRTFDLILSKNFLFDIALYMDELLNRKMYNSTKTIGKYIQEYCFQFGRIENTSDLVDMCVFYFEN